MIWMKAREWVTTRSCIFFFQSLCKYARFLQILLIWSSLINPPEKVQKRVRIPPFAGKLTHDRESSVRQQLFKSSVPSRSPYTAGREYKGLFFRNGWERLYKMEGSLMEFPAINP